MKLHAISNALLPYISSLVVHMLLIISILGISMKPKSKQPKLFQEKTYLLSSPQSQIQEHSDSNVIQPPKKTSAISSPTSPHSTSTQTQINQKLVHNKPMPKIKPNDASATTSKMSSMNQTQHVKKQTVSNQKQKLKKLLDLADQLEQHVTTSEERLNKIELTQAQVEVFSTSNTVMQQELAFCQLLQQYITLPLQGSVRIKFMFEQGEIKECTILSPINELDKQNILAQIHTIPFHHFFNQYNTSKNIVFHIKLRSDQS